ncbi:hypothetical protein BDW59DRAFT_142760 [Aspergillus cavernicola]|uniref:Uncharacterized protein n=1 Tax=Aspergillus cavernicola TaxID=176166 RepID=A0ABR4IN48_9EURO
MKLGFPLAVCPFSNFSSQEIIHYLTHVKNSWATLVDHDRTQMARIDLHTVDTLQLYAPRASTVDRKTVKGKILGGEVFSNFSRSERAAIWENLRSQEDCDGIIPSLHTFFRDISYLELCANAMKRLIVLNKQHPTVRSALVHSLQSRRADSDCLIQTSETTFRRQLGSSEHITSGYCQIWMYAMRHYPEMAKDVQGGQKANPTRAKARAKADESVIHDMATLARKLGFRNPQIKAILKQSPDRQIARAALLKARKPDHYHYERGTFKSLVEQIAGCFALAIPHEAPSAAPATGRAIKLKDRCGAPQEQTQQLDRPHVFLDHLHSATVLQRNLSSLEVRRCVYYAFFGRPSSRTRTTPSGQSLDNEPLLPLFIPNGESCLRSESVAEDMSRSGVSEGSFNTRRNRSETREERHQRREERQHRRQARRLRRQQAAEHRSPPPEEGSPPCSTGEESTVSEAMAVDTWDNSDAEVQPRPESVDQRPAASEGLDVDSEESECTEIDEDELLNQVEDGNPGAEGLAAVEHSTLEAGSDTDISDVPEERAAADTGMNSPVQARPESVVEDHAEMPTTSSRRSHLKAPTPKDKNKDAMWRPYDATQRGNRKEIRRPLAARDQSITRDTEQETSQLAELDVPERISTGAPLAADSQGITPETAEAVLTATNLGSDAAASQSPEKQGRKAALKKDKRQRNLKWAPYFSTRKSNQKEAGREQHAREAEEQLAAEVVEQERLATKAAERAEYQRLQHEATAEAVEELLQEEQVAQERANALAQLQTSGPAEDHVVRPVTELPADLPSLITRLREEGSQLDDESVPLANNPTQGHPEQGAAVSPSRTELIAPSNPPTHQDINRAETRDAVIADELWDGDDGGENPIGTSQPDTERYPGDLPDPEQAQREAIERQEEEDLLFDTPHPLEETNYQEMEEAQQGPPGRRVMVTFHVYKRGEWRTTDVVSVSPDHLAEAQTIANRYARDPNRNARFYDGRLRKVAIDECIRAAIDDGSFTVLMSFGRDLVVTRQVVASVAPLLQTVGSAEPDSEPVQGPASPARRQDHPGKQLKANIGTPLAGPVRTPEDPAPTVISATTQSESKRRNRKKLTSQIVEQRAQDVRPRRAEANPQPVTIVFRVREKNGRWRTAHEVLVDRSDPSEVEQVARKEARNRQATFYDKNLRALTPAQCFEAATEDDTNTIFMHFGGELAMDEDTIRSIAREVEL